MSRLPRSRHSTTEHEVDRLRGEVARLERANRESAAERLLLQLRVQELGAAMQEKQAEFLQILRKLQDREEQAVRRSEDRFRLLVESVKDYAIFMMDPDGVVTSWNTGASRLTGYHEEEILDRHFALLYPEEAIAEGQPDRELNQATHEGQMECEAWKLRKDGSRFWASVLLTALRDEAGRLLGFVMITRDLTEKRRAEEALKQTAAELRRSNQELEQFAYVASHDLQEPLRKIRAFGDRLKQRYASTLEEQARDYVDRMQSAVVRMQSLIDDLLELSRVTTRAQPFTPVDLTAVVREVISDLEVRLERTGGRVELEPLVTVEADEGQMRRLFQNLIGNALKFHRPGVAPEVRVWGEHLAAGAANPAGSGYRIFVRDNGIGFEDKYLDRIFDMFQRLHGRDQFEGTGMGLAICRKIVERHDGSLTAHSEPDQGATFVVTLPLAHRTWPSER